MTNQLRSIFNYTHAVAYEVAKMILKSSFGYFPTEEVMLTNQRFQNWALGFESDCTTNVLRSQITHDILHPTLSEGDFSVEFTPATPIIVEVEVVPVITKVAHLRPGNALFHHLVESLSEFLEVGLRDIVPNYYAASKQEHPIYARCDSPFMLNKMLLMGCVEPNPGPRGRGPVVRRRPRVPYRPRTTGFRISGGSNFRNRRVKAFPDSEEVVMEYIAPIVQLTGGGTTNNLKFSSNLYDVDTALGSTATPGLAEKSPIYSRFTTKDIEYDFEIVNQEAFPVQLIWGFMTNSLSSTALGAGYAGNPHMHQRLLGAINNHMGGCRIRGRVSMQTLFGTVRAVTDDLFTGSTTSSTLSSSATGYFYIGTISAAVPVNGQFVSGSLKLNVLFSRRNAVTS
jgi:hypothetical protein